MLNNAELVCRKKGNIFRFVAKYSSSQRMSSVNLLIPSFLLCLQDEQQALYRWAVAPALFKILKQAGLEFMILLL